MRDPRIHYTALEWFFIGCVIVFASTVPLIIGANALWEVTQ